jgi:GlpG protein
MRQAGALTNRDRAARLVDYLLTQGIVAKFDAEGDSWAIWIRDEDQLPQAKELLREFAADPDGKKYRSVDAVAEALRRKQAADDKRRMKNVIEVRNRWTVGSGPTPVTIALLATSIFISLATNFGQTNNDLQQAIMFQSLEGDGPSNWFLAAPSPVYDIEHGQVWRLVTPIFRHLRILHLLFNMFWLYDLGSMVESRRGSLRFGLLVLVIAVLSNFGQYFLSLHLTSQPSIAFGGMSGVNYGLFGYIWMKSLYDPMAGFRISSQAVFVMVVWFFVCWTGVAGPVANWAHTVGFAVGMAIGYAPVAWRGMAKR